MDRKALLSPPIPPTHAHPNDRIETRPGTVSETGT